MREKSVFINCPFDSEYESLIQSMLFAIILFGYMPRLSSEVIDPTTTRMDRINQMIVECKFSIHDLSMCISKRKGEMYRLNMPFELGIDYSLRLNGGEKYADKEILVLSEKPYTHNAALSDLAGCDVEAHGGNEDKLREKVRNWFSNRTGDRFPGVSVISGKYLGFQEWYFEREEA